MNKALLAVGICGIMMSSAYAQDATYAKIDENTVMESIPVDVDTLKMAVTTAQSVLDEQVRQLGVITTEYQGRVDKAQAELTVAQKMLDDALATGAKLSGAVEEVIIP